MNPKSKLFVISHTHWDREWYQTFQEFRRRLVIMMDEMISHMKNNEEYKYFHLDGQTVVLEDYLQIRPENENDLRDLIKAGRVIIGPWYVMPDEFLVSGESLIKNLLMGHKICSDYDTEPMRCGYVTDIFGHNSQFPQILSGFGIESAILFRGIGDYQKDTFLWEADDGSKVVCMKMDPDRCYSNFFFAIRWPFEGREYENNELISRMEDLIEHCRNLAVSDNLLMMDGVDHCGIEPKLPEILKLFNENINDIEISQCTLSDYINVLKDSENKLEKIHGELFKPGQKGVNNRVVKNVLSSMVHLKQMNNECEILLSKWAEPFDAEADLLGTHDNSGFFNEAWKLLIQNHPHDSICGCSISRVHKDNEHRFDQVMDIGNDILNASLNTICDSINTIQFENMNCIVLFNASQENFSGVIEAELEFPAGSQGNFKLFDQSGKEIWYQALGVRKNCTKRVLRPGQVVDFEMKDYYRFAFNGFIPAVGYNTFGYREYKTIMPERGDYSYKEYNAPTRFIGTMQTGHNTWENEFLKVSFGVNGTLNVFNKQTGKEYKDLMTFEDSADVGDGYDYKRPVGNSDFLSICSRAGLSVVYDGPLAVQWKLVHFINLPSRMDEKGIYRSEETEELKIVSYISMKKGSRLIGIKTEINNNIAEHRLRVLFPNYLGTDKFYTTAPFSLQERAIKREDCSDFSEPDTGVVPNQGVIILRDEKDSLAIYNRGLYEVVVSEDESRTIALTLFRSFKTEIGKDVGELGFMYRKMTFDYALEFFGGEVQNYEILRAGEAWRYDIKYLFTGSHTGRLPVNNSFLDISVPGAILSSYRTNNKGMKILRLYNSKNEIIEGNITISGKMEKAFLLDLKEEIIEDIKIVSNIVHISLKPAQILTMGFIYKLQ